MTEKDAVSLVAMLMAAYPRVEVPKATVGVYQKLLSDLDLCAARCAITWHIASSQYFPSIAEIREAALAFSRPRVPSPGEAWAEVMDLLSSVGSYSTPKFSHAAIKKAVKAIGWRNLCFSENIAMERAHFLRITAPSRNGSRRRQTFSRCWTSWASGRRNCPHSPGAKASKGSGQQNNVFLCAFRKEPAGGNVLIEEQLWQIILDAYGHDEDTHLFLLEIRQVGVLKWALQRAENVESDVLFMKYDQGVPIFNSTVKDATMVRRLLELLSAGKESGPRLAARHGGPLNIMGH